MKFYTGLRALTDSLERQTMECKKKKNTQTIKLILYCVSDYILRPVPISKVFNHIDLE